MKQLENKNYFPIPNEIFSLGLSPGAFSVYCYLLRCENRKSHQCWPSYKTIGAATRMSANTVRKHIYSLTDWGFIRTEDTSVLTRQGQRRNGSLLYTILPFQDVLKSHHRKQLQQLSIEAKQWDVQNLRCCKQERVYPSTDQLPA